MSAVIFFAWVIDRSGTRHRTVYFERYDEFKDQMAVYQRAPDCVRIDYYRLSNEVENGRAVVVRIGSWRRGEP